MRLRLRYRHGGQRETRTYTVDPYGLVAKAGVWYLVADRRGRPRPFRADRVSAAVLGGPVRRRHLAADPDGDSSALPAGGVDQDAAGGGLGGQDGQGAGLVGGQAGDVCVEAGEEFDAAVPPALCADRDTLGGEGSRSASSGAAVRPRLWRSTGIDRRRSGRVRTTA